MRFHLVDRIDVICYDKFVLGTKCITLADDVFDEHFPGYPVFPGSLIQEGMAQLAGSFFEITMQQQGLPIKRSVLSIVNRMKFRRPAWPGDKIILRADIVSFQEEYGVAKVQGSIDGEVCANGELTFAFVEVEHDALQASREELYKICTRTMRVVQDESEL